MNDNTRIAASRGAAWLIGLSLGLALTACGSIGGKSSSSSSGGSAQPAAAADTKSSGKVPPGMNANGEVVDSSKVEGGHGKQVKGLGEWEGEITGKPAPGSAFNKLQIGMSMKQVTDLAGQPTDQGAYITGKMFIPWYFGSDKYRHEMVYKGMGRLIFASPGGFEMGAGNLIWIIHNASEGGYR